MPVSHDRYQWQLCMTLKVLYPQLTSMPASQPTGHVCSLLLGQVWTWTECLQPLLKSTAAGTRGVRYVQVSVHLLLTRVNNIYGCFYSEEVF